MRASNDMKKPVFPQTGTRELKHTVLLLLKSRVLVIAIGPINEIRARGE